MLKIIADHEANAHGGKPCWGNRASAIAHLAHCLGVRGQAWTYAQELLAEYDANCVDRQCPHGDAQ